MDVDEPAILKAADRPFVVARREPSPDLAAAVEYLWSVTWDVPDGTVHEQEVLAYPSVHLTVEAGVGWVDGVPTRRFHRELEGRGWVAGARFRAGGFSACTDSPMADLVDRRMRAAAVLRFPLDGDWIGTAADAAEGCDRLDAALVAAGVSPDPEAAVVDHAVAVVAEDRSVVRVDDLAARLGVGVRTLQRRFERHLGVGPKWVIQRQRLHDVLAEAAAGTVDWARLAAELGFADQAHLVNTFTDVVGVPPERYRQAPS